MDFIDTGEGLAGEALAHVRDLGIKVEVRNQGEDGAVVSLSRDRSSESFAVEAVGSLRPNLAGIVFSTAKREALKSLGLQPLIISERIGPSVAKLARDMSISYVDRSGNMHIESEGLLLHIEGRSPSALRQKSPAGFTKTELQVVLSLVNRQGLIDRSVRDIAEMVGINRGSVQSALTKLKERGYVASYGLRDLDRLFEEWRESYLVRGGFHKDTRVFHVQSQPQLLQALEIDPALLRGYATVEGGWSREVGPESQVVHVLSGELAAQLKGWNVRAASALIYTADLGKLVMTVKPGKSGFPIEVRTVSNLNTVGPNPLAHDWLIKADMILSRDARQIDVAVGRS